MEERKIYTLRQVGTAIKQRIEEATHGASFWVKAEIAAINVGKHAYLELVQHQDGEKVAVMRGAIWMSALNRIRQELGGESRNILKDGVEILFLAKTNYHLVFGLSLVIEQIDLSFNISELERRKRETIATLKDEGLYDRNRFIPMPMVVQRIALVASKGTAAYSDFMKHVEHNEHGYRFHVRLFNAVVQGDAAAGELRAALAAIDPAQFDAVVLIRGGGSKLDLEPFNDLELARVAAQMRIPVLTGIGHDVDVSVLDLIAKGHHKTPTDVADFIVDRAMYFETSMTGMLVQIHNAMLTDFTVRKEGLSTFTEMVMMRPTARCRNERGLLHTTTGQFARSVTDKIAVSSRVLETFAHDLALLPRHKLAQVEAARIREMSGSLSVIAQRGFQLLLGRLQGMDDAIQFLSPEKLLHRGFSITRKDGHAIKDPGTLAPGDEVETTFASGKAWSTIKKIERHGKG
ncbi:MAG: exodeoxyribonuclease VII large subunit [Flavobacteriales bacterium]|jgi:exodeoxyribonuclease VII large subunit|nr:exodeoxyribonuclease VII large subunit [Flavobacteriales bacterium]